MIWIELSGGSFTMKPATTLAVVRLSEAGLAIPVFPHEGHLTSTSVLIHHLSDQIGPVVLQAYLNSSLVTGHRKVRHADAGARKVSSVVAGARNHLYRTAVRWP